jgi:hypothetical protein
MELKEALALFKGNYHSTEEGNVVMLSDACRVLVKYANTRSPRKEAEANSRDLDGNLIKYGYANLDKPSSGLTMKDKLKDLLCTLDPKKIVDGNQYHWGYIIDEMEKEGFFAVPAQAGLSVEEIAKTIAEFFKVGIWQQFIEEATAIHEAINKGS